MQSRKAESICSFAFSKTSWRLLWFRAFNVLKLCIYLYSDQGDWEYWQAIEEACNVNLEFMDSSGGKDALSLLAGTDDLPDIIIYLWKL